MKHFNNLTPAEAERLALLAEECGEAIQVVGKILRHGYDSINPTIDPERAPTNRSMLEKELGDIALAQQLLCDSRDLNLNEISAHFLVKRKKVGRYLHHQEEQ